SAITAVVASAHTGTIQRQLRHHGGLGAWSPTSARIAASSACQSGSLPSGGNALILATRARSSASSSSLSRSSSRIATSDDVTQLLHRVVEVDLRRVLRALGELGDLSKRQIVVHAQLEHELLLRRQLRDRLA